MNVKNLWLAQFTTLIQAKACDNHTQDFILKRTEISN